MQIVIDIHERDYQSMLNGHIPFSVLDVIRNGTPLPKGHGRLIDADKIIEEATEHMKYPANHEYMECVIAHMKLSTTIIEADNGSEVEK